MRTKSLILLCLLLNPAQADTLDIIAGGWSYHTDRSKSYRETHYNIGLSLSDYSILYYRNSKGRHSWVASRDFLWGDRLRYGFAAGVVSGYGGADLPVPAAVAKLQYNRGAAGIDFHTLPGYVYQLQLRYRTDYRPALPSPSGDSDWAASFGYGLTGGTYAVHYQIADGLNLRLSTNQWSKRWSEYHYPAGSVWLHQPERVRISMTGATVDYFPTKHIGIYAGAYYNASEYTTRFIAHGEGRGHYTAAPQPIPVSPGDQINGVARWQRFAPTAGLRFGNPFSRAGWSLYADLGVIHISGIRCRISSNSDISGLDQWRERECAKYNGLVKWLPRAEAGVVYRF